MGYLNEEDLEVMKRAVQELAPGESTEVILGNTTSGTEEPQYEVHIRRLDRWEYVYGD